MAVSIDRVYQKVLALANKEQRGYITPQEFNLFADHAQMEIFDQYFYDLDTVSRKMQNEMDYTDKSEHLLEKISIFERHNITASLANSFGDVPLSGYKVYRLGSVAVKYQSTGTLMAEEIDFEDVERYDTPLTRQFGSSGTTLNINNLVGPVFTRSTGSGGIKLKIRPWPSISTDSVYISFVEHPTSPNWTYNIVGGSAMYNPTNPNYRNFSLHSSEENNLVIKILQLAGISIKDPQLTQIAAQEEISTKREKI